MKTIRVGIFGAGRGVELIRTFEKSNAVYYMAENYPQMCFNREIKRVCDSGTLGKFLYAEGEYIHPVHPEDYGFIKTYQYFTEHWHHYIGATYYLTHSLDPIRKAVTAVATISPRECSMTA